MHLNRHSRLPALSLVLVTALALNFPFSATPLPSLAVTFSFSRIAGARGGPP